LHGALVLLRGGAAGKGAEIAPPAGLRVLLARIKPIIGVTPNYKTIEAKSVTSNCARSH